MAHTTLMKLLQATIVVQAISGVQVAVVMVYMVGGAAGWDFAPTASYYSDWASELIFMPGDKLSFRYDPTDHNLLRVNISDYSTCNTLNPIQQYQSGHDLITLDKPGAYCFICGFAGHCEGGGMLIKLTVMGTVPAVPPPPKTPLPPPPVPLKSPPPPVPLKSPPPPPPLQSPPPPVAEVPSPAPAPLTGHPPSPAYPPPPKPPVYSPPPAVTALPSPPSPPSHSSPKSSPSWPPPSHQNQTNDSSPSTPGAPPPMLTAAPPDAFNDTPAPSPDDFDPDTASLARHFRMGCLVSSLVIAGAIHFW